MRLGKLKVRAGFLVLGDGELGVFSSIKDAEKAISIEMNCYKVKRSSFTIYQYSETMREIKNATRL